MIQDPQIPAQQRSFYTPSTPPKRNRNIWILIAVTSVLIIAVITFIAFQFTGAFPSSHSRTNTQPAGTSTGGNTSPSNATTPATNPSGSSVTPQQAVATVNTYYTHINAQDYQDAYNLWGSSYQHSTSYAVFSQGFATTQKTSVQIGNAVTLSNGTVKVPATVTATVSDTASTTVNTYQGYYIVGQEQGSQKLLSANLQLTTSSNARVDQAVATLNLYYTHINAKDYQDAYNLWGTAYHNSTSYQQFVAGFANTQSVSITFPQAAIVLNEGSVKVPVTIRSVDKTQSGNVIHTYQGNYIIGTEGNTWQLFSASIQ